MEGRRQPGEEQCGMHINCCNANGPRGFALIPKTACTIKDNHIYLNLYLPLQATISLNKKNKVHLNVESDYPIHGKVNVNIGVQKKGEIHACVTYTDSNRKDESLYKWRGAGNNA